MTKTKKTNLSLSRRDFIKTYSAATLAAMIPTNGIIFASGSDKVRVGLIGCGGRGTGAAIDCLNSSANVVITAGRPVSGPSGKFLRTSHRKIKQGKPSHHSGEMFFRILCFQKSSCL
jgi:hypothetical protein